MFTTQSHPPPGDVPPSSGSWRAPWTPAPPHTPCRARGNPPGPQASLQAQKCCTKLKLVTPHALRSFSSSDFNPHCFLYHWGKSSESSRFRQEDQCANSRAAAKSSSRRKAYEGSSAPPTTFVILEMDESHKSPAVEINHPRHVVDSGGSYTFRLLYFCI